MPSWSPSPPGWSRPSCARAGCGAGWACRRSGDLPEALGADADLEAREALARFYRLLDELLPKHRTVFVLRYIEGLELVDVAAATGVSLATIKRWLPRILVRVQRRASGDPLLARYVRSEGSRQGKRRGPMLIRIARIQPIRRRHRGAAGSRPAAG